MRSFSRTNLLCIRVFAEGYPEGQIVQQLVGQIPWDHNVRIMDLVKDPTERLWYAQADIWYGWRRICRRGRDFYRDRNNMNKSDLIETLQQTSGFDLDMAEFVVTEVFQAMAETLVQGKRIELRSFGSFEVRKYKGYTGRKPRTGEKIRIKPKKLPFFKVGKDLKERVVKRGEG